MRVILLTLAVLVCCGVGRAAEPNRPPEAKPLSFWSKLLGKTSSPPVARKTPRPSAKSQVTVDPNVSRASYEEPESPVVMPPVRPQKSKLAPLTSWWRRDKRPSRTMSEYMTEERP